MISPTVKRNRFVREQAERRLSRLEIALRLRTPTVEGTVKLFGRECQSTFARQKPLALYVLARQDSVTPELAEQIFNWTVEEKRFADMAEEFISRAAVLGHKNATRLALDLRTQEAADPADDEYLKNIDAAEYIREKTLELAGDVSETTRRAIAEAIAEGLESGEAIREIAKRVEAVFVEADANRAFVIAETEVMNALNHGAIKSYKDLGVEQHEWIKTPDERYCSNGACFENDGQVAKIGEAFPSGHTAPTAHPRCRCVTAPVVE
jgi:SPP1 gp7 family putative phage head morphogenesis protein